MEKCNRQFGCHTCQNTLLKLQKVLDEASEMINAIVEEHEEFTREQLKKLKEGGY